MSIAVLFQDSIINFVELLGSQTCISSEKNLQEMYVCIAT